METKNKGFILLKKLLNELLRLLPLLGVIIPFLFFDDSWQLVMFVTSMIAFILLVVHVVRKSMYPYIDIEELVNRAKESPIASAIVLFGFMLFMSFIMLTYTLILNR